MNSETLAFPSSTPSLLHFSLLHCVGIADALVGSSGLEPPTSRLSGARSNRLSYEPISQFGVFSFIRSPADCLSSLVEMMGFEPMTPCLQGRCSPS